MDEVVNFLQNSYGSTGTTGVSSPFIRSSRNRIDHEIYELQLKKAILERNVEFEVKNSWGVECLVREVCRGWTLAKMIDNPLLKKHCSKQFWQMCVYQFR